MDGDREPGGGTTSGEGLLAAPVFSWLLPAVGCAGVLVTLFLANRLGNYALLFLPALLLAVPLLASRFLANPVPVICIYLFAIVNLDFFKIGETRLTFDVLVSAILLYGLIVRIVLEGRRVFSTPVEKAYLIYLGLTSIAVVLSVNVAASVKNWGRDLEYLFLFAFLYGIPLTQAQKRTIVGAAVFSSVIPCVTGLIGLILGVSRFLGVETPVGGGAEVVRITGTLAHPVVFSHHLSIVTMVAIALYRDGTWIRRRYLGALIALQLVVLYLTYARTGWGEFAAGVVFLFWLLGYRRVVFLVIPVVAFGLFKIVPNFAGRIENALQADDNSLLWRFGLWAYAITLFPHRPVFGSGPGTFIDYVAYREGFAAHQTWLNLLIETGVVGLAAFIGLTVTIWRALAKKRRDPLTARNPLVVGVFAGWFGLLVGSLVGDPFNLPAASVYLWAFLALALRPDASATPGGDPGERPLLTAGSP